MLAADEYLQAHPELSPVIQRLEDVATAFAYGAPPVSPPSRVKEALLARVHGDVAAHPQQRSPVPFPAGQPQPGARAATTRQPRTNPFSSLRGSTVERRTVVRNPATRRRLPWSFDGWFDFATGWKVATMASGVALLFFAIATTQLAGRLRDATTELNSTQAQLASTVGQLNEAEADLSSSSAQLTDLAAQVSSLTAERINLEEAIQLISANLQRQQQQLSSLLTVNEVVALDSTQETNAQGALFVGEDSLVLVLSGLQPLPDEQTYELWLIPPDSNPVSAGLVQVSGGESPTITADIRLSISSFSAVGLSIEQRGGSPNPAGPEGPVILLGNATT